MATAAPKEPAVKFVLGVAAVFAAPFVSGILLARGAIALGTSERAPVQLSQAGGLSLTPQVVERRARVGSAASVTVANTTARPVRVTLRPRPWLQASDGTVAPNPSRTLTRLLRVTPSTFVLAAGAKRAVRLSLRRHPAGGSLYGALDLTGVPRGARPRHGIAVRYRLIGSLRLDPARPRLRVRAGALKVTGRTGRQAAILPLRNTGNTVEPITGRVVLTGPRGTRPNTLRPVRVVPRRLVNLTLGTYRGLLRGQPPGRYRLDVTLLQGGRTVLHTTRTLTLR